MQNGFINQNTAGVVDNILRAKRGLKISKCVFSKFINYDGSIFSESLNWCKMKSEEEQEIVIPVEKEDIVINKTQYSALTQEMRDLLHKEKYDRVYLCGLETDACVLATAFDLYDFGINPIVLADCCASTKGTEYHVAALKIMERSFGKMNVKSLLDYREE